MDDWKLLKNYATENSEEAFHALVERYSGMVYHAALRQTGNSHAAEEVAQEVFIALAQKANSVPRQATLYGWLFRATRYAVLNQIRKSASRGRREQESLVMQPTSESNEAGSIWERITPHLNDALDRLSAADRELVMLRFFGNQSHKAVAETLGVSEETARKRLSRALERLRVMFAKRGVVVSSLALSAAFAAHGAQAAPVEVVSSCARVAMAKAAAGTALGSAGGIFAFLTSAKTAGLIAGLVLGGAAFMVFKSNSRRPPVAAPFVAQPPTSPATPDANGALPGATAGFNLAGDTAALAAALDKVKAALHDPNPTTLYPNSIMHEAIAGLGDRKKAALPLLEAALNDVDAQVRLRAVDGLGLIGPEAGEAAPLLLGVFRNGGLGAAIPQSKHAFTGPLGAAMTVPIYTDNMILYALGQIHPPPEILPEFARMMRENRSVCHIVFQATRQFSAPGRTLQDGGWLWAMANENSQALNNAFRPLLQDPDSAVRGTAALSLVSALGDQADAGVFPVAAELLKTRNLAGEQDGLALLQGAVRDRASDSAGKKATLDTLRLGPYLNETVSALADAAYHGASENVRLKASQMLEALVPELRKFAPSLAAELEQQELSEAFAAKVTGGGAALPEVVEGLRRFPKAAPDIAGYYARTGSNTVELLPAFTEALSALAPPPNASLGDRTKAVNARGRLADAMQKIAPEMPKPIFTLSDKMALTRIMAAPDVQSDPGRFQRVSAARQLAQWSRPDSAGIFDVSPDEMRRLLAAMRDADVPTYDALVAKVMEIDPHFSIGNGKAN